MNKLFLFTVALLLFLFPYEARSQVFLGTDNASEGDSVSASQSLYNGRVWRNVNKSIKGDPFLFSPGFLQGSVLITGESFNNVKLMYDIYKDEVLTVSGRNIIIQLNKELISEFAIWYQGKEYRFLNNRDNSLLLPEGYSNILYDGKTGVFVKYRKTVSAQEVSNVVDAFIQSYKVYISTSAGPVSVKTKGQFLNLFPAEARELKEYARREKLKVSWKDPLSFVPLARYRDTLIK